MPRTSLIILPHLDDEFAISPILKNILKRAKNNYKIIFIAERNSSNGKKKFKRRKECINCLSLFGVKPTNIIFMNDYFIVEDLKIYNSMEQITKFLNNFHEENPIKKIYTLSLEGGHPDHDALALVIEKFASLVAIKKYFLPAYNSRKTFFLPLSVLRPLKSQLTFFKVKRIGLFGWHNSLKIAWTYKTERHAFFKLLPFLIFKTLFSNKIFITNKIKKDSVDWQSSLTKKVYKTDENLYLNRL